VSLKDRTEVLSTPAQVDAFVAKHQSAAVFKAGTCGKTNDAFRHVEAKLGPREDLPLGLIQVVEARHASNRVSELTGIRHESPQLIFFKDGKAVFDRDNWDITPEDLDAGLREHFAPALRA
jgi:bacillithiol system protein YtxJ